MKKAHEILKNHIEELNNDSVWKSKVYDILANSLRNTSSMSPQIRRALGFKYLLENTDQIIYPFEKIAGSVIGSWEKVDYIKPYEELIVEADRVVEEYIESKIRNNHKFDKSRRWALMSRNHHNANVPYTHIQKLIIELQKKYENSNEIGKQEVAKVLEEHFTFKYNEEYVNLYNELPWVAANHISFDFEKLVTVGINGLNEEIIKRLNEETDNGKKEFYKAAQISIQAAIEFIKRYAITILAESKNSIYAEKRKQELIYMAQICENISLAPPKTFHESLQLVWIYHVISNIAGSSSMSLARLDQYLYPFYKNDIEKNTITREEAGDLLRCLWIKINEPKIRMVQSICLGGVTRNGEDAANDLTKLCIEITGELGLPYPNVSVRINAKSPEWLLKTSLSSIRKGSGQPMLLNDSSWIPNLVSAGFSLEDARDYYNMGCVEIMIQGKQSQWYSLHGVDFPGIFELILNNGNENRAGISGLKTGDLHELETFDSFLNAFLKQVRHIVRMLRNSVEEKENYIKNRYYDPFGSILVDNCLEKGKDIHQGGALLKAPRSIGGHGIATAADSLAAIKKHVYEDKRFNLQQIKDSINQNFKGFEDVRFVLDNKTPKYGNDLNYVDEIAIKIYDELYNAVSELNDGSIPNVVFLTHYFSYYRHVVNGEIIEATPDGRYRSEPYSDTINASQGKDKEGPTKLINSILKLDHSKITGAYALNLKFNPSLLEGKQGLEILTAITNTYFGGGGLQLQINFVDTQTLVEAQKNPEKYSNVVVRIAGYCEYFTKLDRHLQDEIIKRTAHEA